MLSATLAVNVSVTYRFPVELLSSESTVRVGFRILSMLCEIYLMASRPILLVMENSKH